MVEDEYAAINRGSREYRIDEAQLEELLRLRAAEDDDPGLVSEWVQERAHLIEEITCDVVATELTLAAFEESGVEPGDVLVAILHGFYNHSSMEVIRDHARHFGGAGRPTGVIEIAARKTVWRTIAPAIWGPRAGGPADLRDRLTW
jgi:hypothetical protein